MLAFFFFAGFMAGWGLVLAAVALFVKGLTEDE